MCIRVIVAIVAHCGLRVLHGVPMNIILCHGNVTLDAVLHFGPDLKIMEASSDSDSVSSTFDLNSMSSSQSPQPENAEDVTIPTLSARSDFI